MAILPGQPGEVRVVELPDPGPARGSAVRLRMLRAPVNPADLLAIDRRYAFALDPACPLGAEGVGRVEAVGEQVGDLRPGDLALPLDRGNWCCVRLVDRSALIPLPADIDLDLAAVLRINPATAWLMLKAAGLGAGDVLVQNAATSSVAAWVRHFAAGLGVTVVDIVRRPDQALPAAIVDGAGLAERARAVAGTRAVRSAFDCVAGEASGRLAECLDDGGRLLIFGHLSAAPISVDSRLLTGRGLSIAGFSLRPAETALGPIGVQAMFAAILDSIARGVPPLRRGATVPLEQAERAIALARAGSPGRVLLAPEISGM